MRKMKKSSDPAENTHVPQTLLQTMLVLRTPLWYARYTDFSSIGYLAAEHIILTSLTADWLS